jgi:dihydrofolate reductase
MIIDPCPCALTLIAACGLRGELGLHNKLPWSQPRDMRFFSKTTRKSVIILGRNTFEDLGEKLPGRTHCILSTTMQPIDDPDVVILRNIESLWDWLKKNEIRHAYVIGGSHIYHQLVSYCSTVLITHIHAIVEADVFLDLKILWPYQLTHSYITPPDEENKYAMTFATYNRSQEVVKKIDE